jgi:hypothetical protein
VHRFYKIYVRRNDGNGISALEPSQYQARFVQRVVRDIFDGLSDVEPEENTDGDVGDEEQDVTKHSLDPKLSMASTVKAGAGAGAGSGSSVHSNGSSSSPSKITGGSGSENSGSNSGGGGNNSGMNRNKRPNEQQFMTLADIEPSNML